MLYGFYGLLQVLSDCRLPAPDLNLPVPLVWMNGTIAMIRGSQSLRVMQDVVNDDRCQVHRHGYLCPQQRSRLAKQDLVEPLGRNDCLSQCESQAVLFLKNGGTGPGRVTWVQ